MTSKGRQSRGIGRQRRDIGKVMTQLLIYESQPLNAALFHRLADLELREVRSLMQLTQAMRPTTAQVIAIEVTEQKDLLTVAKLVQSAKRSSPSLAIICMPRPAVRRGTCCLYEAGADLIFRSMLDRNRVRSLLREAVRRHGREQSEPNSLQERVYAGIPWKRHAK